MKTITSNIGRILLFNLLLFTGLLISGCSKKDDIKLISSATNTGNVVPTKFTNTLPLINHELKVSYAMDDGTNITASFNDLTFFFSLEGTNTVDGTANVWNDLFNVRGKWEFRPIQNANTQYILFILPTQVHNQLAFMNREWQINSVGSEMILISVNGAPAELRYTTVVK